MATDPLVIDTYEGDGPHHWSLLPPEVVGAIVKVSQGTYYYRDAWLAAAIAALGDRRRGGFHYLDFHQGGAAQARYHLTLAKACGLYTRATDFLPAVDVEWNGSDPNSLATPQQIVDCVSSFAAEIQRALGVLPMLYTNCSMMAAKGLRGLMGCAGAWIARYTGDFPSTTKDTGKPGAGYADVGIALEEIYFWQYAGDGVGYLKNYPARFTAFGTCDVSVAIAPSGPATNATLARATIGGV
jgi:GH25 family lysozyme M1 (1,4-beta-N-acetylmuramidase)